MVARSARWALLILVVIILGGGFSALTLWRQHQIRLVLRTSPGINLGSKQPSPYSPVGWLMPEDTRISTSYVENQTFDRNYMNAYVTVLSNSSYQLQPGTVLSFGLYINGNLMGSRTCLTDNLNGSGGWASIGTISNVYTLSTFECGVSLSNTPFPGGTRLTVTVWSNHPTWIQVDSSPTTRSYETFNVTSLEQPLTINPMSGSVASHTITVDAYSD